MKNKIFKVILLVTSFISANVQINSANVQMNNAQQVSLVEKSISKSDDRTYIQIDKENIVYNYYIGSDNIFHYGDMTIKILFPEGCTSIGYVKEKLRDDLNVKWVPYSKMWYDINESDTSLTITTRMKPILRIKFCALKDGITYYTEYLNVTEYIAKEDMPYINRYIYDPGLEVSAKEIIDDAKVTQSEHSLDINISEPSTITVYDLGGNRIFDAYISEPQISIPLSNIGKGLFVIKIETNSSSNSQKIFIR